MLLNAIDVGTGSDTILLLHGMMGSAESWGRVIRKLERPGRRILSLDLPGHGLSARDPHLTIESAAASVVETMRHLAPEGTTTAVGHSYGATVLAAAFDELCPDLAVYIDAGLTLTGGVERAALTAEYERNRQARLTPERLRASRPHYSAIDAEVEARAAERFDSATTASISCGPSRSWLPTPGSIVVHADPSDWLSPDDIHRLQTNDVSVRGIPGAEHTIWYSHFTEFVGSLPEVFGAARHTLP